MAFDFGRVSLKVLLLVLIMLLEQLQFVFDILCLIPIINLVNES